MTDVPNPIAQSPFELYLERSIHAARFIPDALDPVAAVILENVLARYNADAPIPFNEKAAIESIQRSTRQPLGAHLSGYKLGWEDSLASDPIAAAALARYDAGKAQENERAYRLGFLRATYPNGWDEDQDVTHEGNPFDAQMHDDLDGNYPVVAYTPIDQRAPVIDVASGMVLVPREATAAMIYAYQDCPYEGGEDKWSAMVAAYTPIAQPVAPSREAAGRIIDPEGWEIEGPESAYATRLRNDAMAKADQIFALTPDAAKSDVVEAQR